MEAKEPTKQNYSFDFFVASSDLPPPEDGEEPTYTYSVRLFHHFVDVPADRVLTDRFPLKPLGEFLASPCELIGTLSSKGVCVILKKNEEVIGAGSGVLPGFFLRQLTDPNFEVTHMLDVELQKRKKKVADIELNIKMAATHKDVDNRLAGFGCYDVCKPVDKSINARDVIFTLGRSGKCPATTCITDQRLMSHVPPPFSCQHGQRSQDAGECGCKLHGMQPPKPEPDKKKELLELHNLLDELDLDALATPPPRHSYPNLQQRECECGKLTTTTDTGSDDLDMAWSDDGQDNVGKAKAPAPPAPPCIQCPALKPPDLTIATGKPPRLCPMCSSDISWLPLMAACPQCGYKCFAELTDEPYDEKMTAQQLLREFFRKPVCESGSEQDPALKAAVDEADPEAQLTCDCLGGRPCTRCRIRKLCEAMFIKDNIKTTEMAQNDDSKVERKPSTVSQRRTQLVNIFTEMRNAYEKKKSSPDIVNDTLKQECEAQCKNSKSARDRRRARRTLQLVMNELEQAYPTKKKKRMKPKRRPRSKRYCFLEPIKRPPRIGHQCCISDSPHAGYARVPCHMGWMWTKSDMARHKKWKPGAIMKPIREIMCYFLRDFPVDTICLSRYHYRRRRQISEPEEEPLVQHPTLHISKKNDEYTITLRPLKDPQSLALCANPYADMKPVVFRISKDPVVAEQRRLKRMLKKLGFSTCQCRRPVAECFCRSFIDKKRISMEVGNMCVKDGWQDMSDTFVFSDTSDSEAEYDFGVTPPAGLIKPERLKKPDIANCETQYDPNDWATSSAFPHPPNALIQYAGCTAGERKKRFNWIYGKGNVHAEPKPPKMRNIKKKKKRGKPGTAAAAAPAAAPRQKGGYVSAEVAEAYMRSRSDPMMTRTAWARPQSTHPSSYTDVSEYQRRYR